MPTKRKIKIVRKKPKTAEPNYIKRIFQKNV